MRYHTKYPHTCATCGEDFTSENKSQVYCSSKCFGQSVKKTHTKTCLQCGTVFTTIQSRSIFCSQTCFGLYHRKRIVVTCQRCGKEIETTLGGQNRKRYCSKACQYRTPNAGKHHSTFYTKTCEGCSIQYTTEFKYQRFCSRQCAGKQTRKQDTRTCPTCHVSFTCNPSSVQKYCSLICAQRSASIHLTCETCGKEFLTSPSKKGRRRFCSMKCKSIAYRQRTKQICAHCGKVFEKSNWYAENGSKFCSQTCAGLAIRTRIIVACATCGKEIERTPSQAAHGVKNYCCRLCSDIGARIVWTDDELKELWRHGTQYIYYWRRIASRIRQRDEHTCQLCGKYQAKPAHPVHHIHPLSAFTLEDIFTANRDENLITLCKVCHRRVHGNPALLTRDPGIAQSQQLELPLLP
jgi:endogenous inhibitor of DNA gyrase (YacG/DUF329 family)